MPNSPPSLGNPPEVTPSPAHTGAVLGFSPLPELVLQTMPWGVLSLNEQGVVTLLNPYAARLLGCKADTARGQRLPQLVPPEFPPELLQTILAAISSPSPVVGEYFLPYCQRWVEMRTEPGDTEMLVFWQDVTRVKQKQQQFQTLAHNVPDVLTRWGPDLRLRYANPALEGKTGQPLGALLGKTFPEMGAPDSITGPYNAKLQQVFDTGQPVEHYNSFPTPQGERHYHSRLVPEHLDGHVESVLAIARDITAAQRAAAELREANDLLRRVLDAPNVGLSALRAVRDGGQLVDFEYQLVSRRHSSAPGKPALIGQRLLETYPELHPYLARMRQVVETGATDTYEVQVREGAQQRWYLNSNAKLGDGFVNMWTDITDRKLVEQELLQSKALFEAVFNSSTRGMTVLRSVRDAAGQLIDFEILLANALTEKEVGHPIVGLRMLADWPYSWPSDKLFQNFANTVQTGQPLSKEYYLERDGRREWFYWRGIRLDDGLVATFENITSRKEAEQALRQAHEQLQTIFQAVPVELGYYHAVRDEAGQLVDLRLAAANDASFTRMQLASNASEHLMSVQLPGLRELPVWQRIREVIATGQQQRFELYHDFGTAAYWFDTVYTRLDDGIISASLDITARKQMEQALQESKDLLHAIFNATLDSLEVLRSVRDEAGQLIDFEWVLTNEAAQRLMHRSDLTGKRLLAEEPTMQTSGVFDRLRQVADQQQAADFEQHYPFDGDGEWFHVAAAPLGDGIVVNWHDITARKKAASELLRLQLAQQQQLTNAVLDAQESERHRIAESLHNGLGQLLYATQLHLNSLVATASPQAFAESKRKTEHLLKTAIDQTRTLSHQLTPNILQDFGLEVAVQDICRDFDSPQLRLHAEVSVSRSLPPSLALALYRMVQELINNVAKHAHATEASLHLLEHDGWLELQADDNGQGFDHTQPRTKGMGLNALRDRVKLLNGLLTITSAPGQGTHVNIRIPLVAPTLEVALG